MILAISLFEALIFVYMSHTLSIHTIESIVNNGSETNEALYSDILGNWFSERIGEIQMYANSPDVKSMDWERAEPYLKNEIKNKLDFYDHFLVVEPSGSYNTTLKRNPSNASDRKYFTDAMQGRSGISTPIISRTNGNQIIVAAAPVKDDDGRIIGVMGGAINLVKLEKIIEPFKVDHPGSYSFIVDRDGLIISHPDTAYIMQESLTKESHNISGGLVGLSSKILSTDAGSSELAVNNNEYMLFFHVIPNTDGWRILTLIPLSYLRGPIYYTSKMLSVFGIIGILLSLVAGIAVSKTISKPIIQLKDLFVKAEAGDMSVEANINTHDEIEDAAKSFNRMMQTISNLTFNDPLTGLPNMSSFMERLKLEIDHAAKDNEKLAVIAIDIDKFESINNTLGHATGNRLLQEFAHKLQGGYGHNNVISRISEDKFAILLPGIASEKDAVLHAQNILKTIKQPMEINGHMLYITAGIGIAFYPGDADSSEALFKNAYSAMQRAKRSGRDNYQLYDSTTSISFAEHLYLDNSMHNALKNDEFILHYQPQVNIATNKIAGMEALLRWKHPELGMIAPSKFIPIAESNGLIIPIGDWVLLTACRQLKRLHEQGFGELYVSVNISAVQFKQEDFLAKLYVILGETELEPRYLELEITESILMENTSNRIETLNSLKKMGIRIAIDDFGTGYSSLNYLKDFEITTIKIDQSFTRDITSNPKVASIVSAILAIGRNLKLSVTAEGVETEEQLAFLKRKRCNAMQGYLYSKPVPMEEFEEMLKR